MKKKKYEGTVKKVVNYQIYLNIDDLEQGTYVLKITDKNKTIQKTIFIKK